MFEDFRDFLPSIWEVPWLFVLDIKNNDPANRPRGPISFLIRPRSSLNATHMNTPVRNASQEFLVRSMVLHFLLKVGEVSLLRRG